MKYQGVFGILKEKIVVVEEMKGQMRDYRMSIDDEMRKLKKANNQLVIQVDNYRLKFDKLRFRPR